MFLERELDLLDAERKRRPKPKPIVRTFEAFGYLSDKIPREHAPALSLLARDLVRRRARTVVVVGHAFGSTMERKYDLGFRRALRVARKLRDLIEPIAADLPQFPRFVVASVGDTSPRMGTTASADRRVAVIFRPGH